MDQGGMDKDRQTDKLPSGANSPGMAQGWWVGCVSGRFAQVTTQRGQGGSHHKRHLVLHPPVSPQGICRTSHTNPFLACWAILIGCGVLVDQVYPKQALLPAVTAKPDWVRSHGGRISVG